MKKILLTVLLALVLLSQMALASRPTAILGPGMGGANFRVPYHETTVRVLSRDTTYILTGWYFIDSTYSITIPAGTLIRGDSASGGSLIVKRGAKIHAVGTRECPIVFTSNKPAGSRTPGDWGGPILLGNAPCNFGTATNVQIEGGFGSFPNTDALYGGNDPDDNSGEMEYVRIEFAGIAFAQDNEINGLTLGGVGRGTKLDHIQVSFSNDDDVEMFGGTVDLKYYIGWRMLDDDIDTDQGYSGRIQFAYEKRDPALFDASAPGSSEGYESDGESPQFTSPPLFNHQPHTQYHASNVTIVGPQKDTGFAVNAKWTVLARLRRADRIGIYNNILVGYPQGIDLRDTATQRYAAQDSLQIRNTSIQSKIKLIFEDSSPNTGNITGFNAVNWFNGDSGYADHGNRGGRAVRQPVDVGLRPEVFNLDWTNNPVPLVGSEADTAGTSFEFAGGDPFFDSVSYRGAFDPHLPRNQQWDWGWTNYDPQNYDPEATVSAEVYSLTDSWNLVSLPFSQVTDPSVGVLFPTAAGNAFSYNGSYVANSSLTHGPGYWLKFTGNQSAEVVGCLKLKDTVDLRSGWSLIGSVADTVPVASVTTNPPAIITSNFFEYNGAYAIASSIEPGKAYWVKTSSTGQLFLDGLSTPKPKTSPREAVETNSAAIKLTDRRGKSENLYIYNGDKLKTDVQRYSAPPLPPSGGFDARFSTDRIAEPYRLADAVDRKSYNIRLSGAEYPVTISLSSSDFISGKVVVSEMLDGKSIQEHVLEPNSSIMISDKAISSLSLTVGSEKTLPSSYELSQNYPNPFNPTTRLTVSVPYDSHVDVSVYNLLGEKIATLLEGNISAGYHTVEWNGVGAHGTVASSGMYLVRMTAGSYSATRRMMFLK